MASAPKFALRGLSVLLCLGCASAAAQPDNGAALQRYSIAAQTALATGRFQEAESDYREMLRLRPDLAEIHVTLGAIYFQEKRFEQAVSELRTALKLKPGLPKAGPLLSMSLAELGSFDEALPGLEKGFRQSADPQVKRMCGLQLLRAYTELLQNEKAVELALELDHLYPKDAEILYHTGQVYGNLAFLNMRKLATVAPDSTWRHLAAAEAYESQGAYLPAISEYQNVLAIDPRHANVHYRLGRTLLARSEATQSAADADAASQEFKQELEVDPSNANAAYELAEIYRKANQMEAAKQYFEMALKYYSNFEDAQLGLAATLMALQQPQLALPHLEKAILINSTSQVAWYRLSRADRALGDTAGQTKALAEFQRLRATSANQSDTEANLTSNTEVTPQQLDSDAPH